MRARGNFRYGLAGSWVGITQFSLSGVHGYSNEFKCVFLRDYCVSLRQLLHIFVCNWVGVEYVDGGLGTSSVSLLLQEWSLTLNTGMKVPAIGLG